jgi:hypothetical protein
LTYLGGNSGEGSDAIAADDAGDAYVVGKTGSDNFPRDDELLFPACVGHRQQHRDGIDVLVSKISDNSPPGRLGYASEIGAFNPTDQCEEFYSPCRQKSDYWRFG